MKKILGFLFVILINTSVFAGCDGRNDITDRVTNVTYNNCRENHWNGVRVFCDFPNVSTCEDQRGGACGHRFGNCKERLCDGFKLANYENYKDRVKAVAEYTEGNNFNKCWKWECTGNHVMGVTGGRCYTPAECSAAGSDCLLSNSLCSDLKGTFVESMHDVVMGTNGGCNTFKCKPGWCSDSVSAGNGGTCRKASEIGTVGGEYGDANGVCQTCEVSTYVTADANFNYRCIQASAANIEQMAGCLSCAQDDEKFKACVKNGTKCE